jgi:hypothetical protein
VTKDEVIAQIQPAPGWILVHLASCFPGTESDLLTGEVVATSADTISLLYRNILYPRFGGHTFNHGKDIFRFIEAKNVLGWLKDDQR